MANRRTGREADRRRQIDRQRGVANLIDTHTGKQTDGGKLTGQR